MESDTDGVHSSVKAIQELEAACARFTRAVVEQLPEVARELAHTTEALEEHRTNLRDEISELENRLSSADEDDNMSWEVHRLDEAKNELSSTLRHIRSLAEVSATYSLQARKVEHLANSHSLQTREFLNGTVEDLKAYIANSIDPAKPGNESGSPVAGLLTSEGTNTLVAARSEPPQLARGKRAHKEEPVLPGEKCEVPTPSGKRMDRYNEGIRHIREIKPNNPRAVKDGQRQVEGYRIEMEAATGAPHTSEVSQYNPDKYAKTESAHDKASSDPQHR